MRNGKAPALLWLACVVNVTAGLILSPSTAVRKVTVVGATPDQQAPIRRSLQTLKGVPAGLASRHALLTRVLADHSVLRADWQQNVFGRGKLKVTPQRPVGVIDRRKGILLAATGELFLGTVPAGSWPWVVLPENAGRASLTLLGNWEASRIAELCDLLTNSLPENSWKVVQENDVRVAIISEKDARVILGSTERFPEKIAALRALLDENPKLLRQVAAINLSAESNPAIVPLRGAPIE